MTSTKASTKTTGIGILAFLTILVAGAWGVVAAKKDEEDKAEKGRYEDITPDTTTLIDSLEGIEVPGDSADLLKVRVLGLERAKLIAMWGSKGVNHDEPTKFNRLVDLTTEHLVNIKNNSANVSEDEKRIIGSILEDRVASGEADADVLGL